MQNASNFTYGYRYFAFLNILSTFCRPTKWVRWRVPFTHFHELLFGVVRHLIFAICLRTKQELVDCKPYLAFKVSQLVDVTRRNYLPLLIYQLWHFTWKQLLDSFDLWNDDHVLQNECLCCIFFNVIEVNWNVERLTVSWFIFSRFNFFLIKRRDLSPRVFIIWLVFEVSATSFWHYIILYDSMCAYSGSRFIASS